MSIHNKYAVHAARFADTVGDGSGSINANVDGSVTPVDFMVTAAEKEILVLHRLIVTIVDTAPMDSGAYGNNLTLTNGIKIYCKTALGVETERTAQHAILTNAAWGAYCYDVQNINWGAGAEQVTCRYTFDNDGESLILNPGESYIIRIADDLTGLIGHHFRLGMTSRKIL